VRKAWMVAGMACVGVMVASVVWADGRIVRAETRYGKWMWQCSTVSIPYVPGDVIVVRGRGWKMTSYTCAARPVAKGQWLTRDWQIREVKVLVATQHVYKRRSRLIWVDLAGR